MSIEDPAIQLLIFIAVAVGVFVTFKFVMNWAWKSGKFFHEDR